MPPQKNHQTILLTGTTGFVGSSLAAAFLQKGAQVLSLSRNDPDGARTRAAVSLAAQGFGTPLTDAQARRLTVLDVQFNDLESTLTPARLAKVTHVWHCAAHMSYSTRKIQESLAQNLEVTTRLYSLMKERAPNCQRIFHVSTAYTAGIQGGFTPAQLHPAPRLINGYQISKWCAEQALSNLAREPLGDKSRALPLSIFRPSIIVGHTHTGWAPSNSFGFYMFVDSFRRAAELGYRKIAVDVVGDSRPNVLPIDEVIRAAVGLTERPRTRELIEIFHCATPHNISLQGHFDNAAEVLGISIKSGPPRTLVDRKLNEGIAFNREFASTTYDFDISNLKRAVGRDFCTQPLTPAQWRKIMSVYIEQRRRETKRLTPMHSRLRLILGNAIQLPSIAARTFSLRKLNWMYRAQKAAPNA